MKNSFCIRILEKQDLKMWCGSKKDDRDSYAYQRLRDQDKKKDDNKQDSSKSTNQEDKKNK